MASLNLAICHSTDNIAQLQPAAYEFYPFQLPTIHPALLSNSHLLNLTNYTKSCDVDRFEQNNNEKAESSCGSSGESRESTSPASTRDNVIVRNEKRKKDQVKDDAYWERRRKNNDAAKRSRDQRRQKEDEMANRAANLEHENMRLRVELEQLRAETDQLRALILAPPPTINVPLPTSLLAPSVITQNHLFSHYSAIPPVIAHRSTVLVSNPTKT